MTNRDKAELRQLAKEGLSFKYIRDCVDCCDATIRMYIKIFRPLVIDTKKEIPITERKGR